MTANAYGHIGVICGGTANEAPISRQSGQGVLDALHRLGYSASPIDPINPRALLACDTAFIALHGPGGEDGTIQGFFETIGTPYTGSPTRASSISMNKRITNTVLRHAQLPCPDTLSIHDCVGPVVIKPESEGSSLGVHIVHDAADIAPTYAAVLAEFGSAMIESYIPGTEVTVSLLHHNGAFIPLPILELRPVHHPFYNYEAKYTAGATDFILPAPIPPSVADQCHTIAQAAFNCLGCRGFARVDMRITPDNVPYILEINSIPGLTPLSDLPAQAKHAGIHYDQLIDIMLQSAKLEA
ncbi:MAG: D-alanine--D-alanine ligase [Candidatus Marinamargulisbacteria bacterium]|nr:D-alanine--D-alanine ligase [Candidatus Marinamargulisbacteria bacterium]